MFSEIYGGSFFKFNLQKQQLHSLFEFISANQCADDHVDRLIREVYAIIQEKFDDLEALDHIAETNKLIAKRSSSPCLE